jgi:hypothetical protein
MVEHLESPGHTPGSLPDCPACDLEFARQAYVQSVRSMQGGRCPMDEMEMLDSRGKRLVETALAARQDAEENGIPLRDAIHRLNRNDVVKATIASWVDPDSVGDFTGDLEDRRAARQANDDRARRRLEDNVLRNCSGLEPGDQSLEAKQIRQTAASIRDHREAEQRRLYWEKYDEGERLLDEARALYAERDEWRDKAHAAQQEAEDFTAVEDYENANARWKTASGAAAWAKKLDDQAEPLVMKSIEIQDQARQHDRSADDWARANRTADKGE